MEIKFNIGEKEWQLPEVITLEAFERAVVWDLEDEKQIRPFVATILECPIFELEKLDIEVFAFIAGCLIQRMDPNGAELQETIDDFRLKELDEISFGEWVDLDLFATWGAMQNISKIAAILYGAPETTTQDWDIKRVWKAVEGFGHWRASIYTQYEEFFELEGEAEEGEGPKREANIQLMWYEAIMVLAGEDFTKIERVTSRPFKEALNWLTWKKAKIAQQKLEQLKRKNDLQRNRR